MEHARDHEQTEEVPRLGPVGRQRLLVVIDRHERGQRCVGPAEVHQKLASAIAERREIRIGRVEELTDVAHPIRILLEVEALHVVARVGLPERHVPHERLGEGELERFVPVAADQPSIPAARGASLADRRGARDLGAERLARKVGVTVPDHAAVDRRERARLRLGDAARSTAAGAFRQVTRGIEGATPRIVDDAVGTALRVDDAGDELQGVEGQRPIGHGAGIPEPGDGRVDEVQHGRARDDAVEVARESLRRDHRLPASGRAAIPVRIGNRTVVVPRRDSLRGDRGQVDRPERVVGDFLGIEGEGGQRLFGRVVTGVGRGGHEALPQRGRADRGPGRAVRDFAGEAAVAAHVEAAVPGGGQIHLEVDLGRDRAGDSTVLRHALGGRDDLDGEERHAARRQTAYVRTGDLWLHRGLPEVERRPGRVDEAVAVLRRGRRGDGEHRQRRDEDRSAPSTWHRP